MALEKTLYSRTAGAEVTAYCVIDGFTKFNKALKEVRFEVDLYERACTKEERANGTIAPFTSIPYSATADKYDLTFGVAEYGATNPVAIAYSIAKESQPATDGENTVELNRLFGAIDC